MDSNVYNAIVEARKVLSSTTGTNAREAALNYLYKQFKSGEITNEDLKIIESNVPGITEKINRIDILITHAKRVMDNSKESTDTLFSMHKNNSISMEEYNLMERYVPGITAKLKELSKEQKEEIKQERKIDYYNLDIEQLNKEQEKLQKELNTLEVQRQQEDKIIPLSEEEKRIKEEKINELENERANTINKIENISYMKEQYNEFHKYDNINIEQYLNQKESLEKELKLLEEQKQSEDKIIPLNEEEKRIKEEKLKELENERTNNLNKLEQINYAIKMYNKAQSTKTQTSDTKEPELDEYTKNLIKYKDEISNAIYNYDIEKIADFVDKGIISSEHLKTIAESSEYKKDGEKINDLYTDVMNRVNNSKTIEKQKPNTDFKWENAVDYNNAYLAGADLQEKESDLKTGPTVENEIELREKKEIEPHVKKEIELYKKINEFNERGGYTPPTGKPDKEQGGDIITPPGDNPLPPKGNDDTEEDKEKEKQEKLRKARLNVDQIIKDALGETKVYIGDAKIKGKLQASNISVKDSLHSDLKTGNVVYNVSNLVKAGIKSVKIIFDKITARNIDIETKNRINNIYDGFSNLSLEQKKVLYDEFKGSEALGKKLPAIVIDSISKTIEDYGRTKASPMIISNVERYKQIMDDFATIKEIDEKLKTELSEEEKQDLINKRENLVKGKAELIEQFNNTNTNIKNIMSSGIYGTKEDINATKIGYATGNYAGNKFADKHDLNNDLIEKEAKLKTEQLEAIALGNDEDAMQKFVQYWELRYENTENQKKRLLGDVSVGEREFYPVEGIKEINHEKDTLVRDLLGTAAIATATASAITNVYTHFANNDIIDAFNMEINKGNKTINEIGENITNKHDVMSEGIQANANSEIAGMQDILERQNATKGTDNQFYNMSNDYYKEHDPIAHQTVAELYKNTETGFKSAMDKYVNGELSQTDALSEIAKVANNSNEQVNQVYAEVLPGIKEYAANKPQFDLTGLIGSLEKVVENPDATINFNNGIVEIMKDGEKLANFNIETLNNIKDPLAVNLTAAVATSAAIGKYMDATKTNNRKQNIDLKKELQGSLIKSTENVTKPKEKEQTKTNSEKEVKLTKNKTPVDSKPKAKETPAAKKVEKEKTKENNPNIKNIFKKLKNKEQLKKVNPGATNIPNAQYTQVNDQHSSSMGSR